MSFKDKLAFWQQQNSLNSHVVTPQENQNKNIQPIRKLPKNIQPISTENTPPNKVELKKDDHPNLKSAFAKNLEFFKKNATQNNQSTQVPIKDTPRDCQPSKKFANKLDIYNNLKVPLGQPTDYRKKQRTNVQTDNNIELQLVFPTELLEEEKDDESSEMPFRRQVRFTPGRRRPTNIFDE